MYLEEIITQYASKMKLWEGTDLLELLSKEEEIRRGSNRIELLYRRAWSGKAYTKMYKKHRELRMPFHFIPSCSRFKAVLSPYDWIFALFGVAIRGKGSTFEIRSWRTGRANKYLFGMFLQLGRHRDKGEGELYWKAAWRLMSSHTYQVSAFNYVHHNWHREMSLKDVNRIMAGVKKLVETRATEIKFKRVYIPKGDGRVRPLGVPSLEWRVYLHMLNNLIVWNRNGKEGHQHAYYPGRGVHTAWSEIFTKLDSPFIYEFDLRGFFDNVNIRWLSERLKGDSETPISMVEWFAKLNRSIPKLLSEDPIPEPDRSVLHTADWGWNPNAPRKENDNPLYNAPPFWDGTKYIDDLEWEYPKGISNVKEKGVPQGAATSCGLSVLALSHITDPGSLGNSTGFEANIVMYADDGIIFLNREQDLDPILNQFEKAGVTVNEEKSGWIKKRGRWQRDIKFLGIRYSGEKGTIHAETRKGATLEFGLKEQFLAYLLEKRENILFSGSAKHLNSLESYRGVSVKSWVLSELTSFFSIDKPQSLLFKGKWSGYFLSSLYCDSWDKSNPQNSELTCSNRSCWVRMVWPQYRRQNLARLAVPLLESKLREILVKIDAYPQKPIFPWFAKEGSVNLFQGFKWDDLMPIHFEAAANGRVKALKAKPPKGISKGTNR